MRRDKHIATTKRRLPILAAASLLLSGPFLSPMLGPRHSPFHLQAETTRDEPADPQETLGGNAFSKGMAELKRTDSIAGVHPDDPGPRLKQLRLLWALGVKDSKLTERGLREIEALRKASSELRPSVELLDAYQGAFLALQAKHALWPPKKLEHLENALPYLDGAVAASPDDTEIRYVRLMSCYYLPFFFGRKESVRDDFTALAHLLPKSEGQYPDQWFADVSRFVLKRGDLAPEQRRELETLSVAAENRAKRDRGNPQAGS